MADPQPKPLRPMDVPLFDGALPAEGQNYLGNATLVEDLVRNFIADVATATDYDSLVGKIDDLAMILTGNNPEYMPIPGWNDRNELGVLLCSQVGVDQRADWMTIMRTALAKLANEVQLIVREAGDLPLDQWDWKIDGLIEFWTSMLLGTLSLTHPELDLTPLAPIDEGPPSTTTVVPFVIPRTP